MSISKQKREAIALITKDLQERMGTLVYEINSKRSYLKQVANELAILKRKRVVLFELVRKLEDGLLGELGRWCGECGSFGHRQNCKRIVNNETN